MAAEVSKGLFRWSRDGYSRTQVCPNRDLPSVVYNLNAKGCNDQANHNLLVWGGRLASVVSLHKHTNEDGPILTVGTCNHIEVDAWGVVRNLHGGIPAVVHQYQHHPDLEILVRQRFPYTEHGWRSCFHEKCRSKDTLDGINGL